MGYTDNMSPEMKQRIVQELVPGKQISLAHIIANPDKILYTKLGLDPSLDYSRAAIGIMTVRDVYKRQVWDCSFFMENTFEIIAFKEK